MKSSTIQLTRRDLLAGTAAAGGAAVLPSAANAVVPLSTKQAPGFYRFKLGDYEVTILHDGARTFPLPDTFVTNVAKDQALAAATDAFMPQGKVTVPFNPTLINTGTKLVLIDTGTGGAMGPTTGKLLVNLRAAGYGPEQVDEIYITHMHGDHIGGLSSGEQPNFPNAVVRTSKAEADYWLDPAHLASAPAEAKGGFQSAQAAFAPYVKAGKFKTFDVDGELLPGISSMDTHGHTPGHTSYLVASKGIRLLVLGDLIHVGAVQFARPSVAMKFDSDNTVAIAARIKAFDTVAKGGYWVAASHLSFPAIGHIRAEKSGYTWLPANYSLPH
jgi:glyoxylase-like metal-dependent hydrolase (beta-lactamase superfamily II)